MNESREPRPVVSGRPLLQQAPVRPLDASGFTASVVGTTLFGLAAVVVWVVGVDGHWPRILVTATALGLALIPYTAWHRHRARVPEKEPEPDFQSNKDS